MGFLDSMKKTLGSTAQALQKAADSLPDNVKDLNLNDKVADLTRKGEEALNTVKNESQAYFNNEKTLDDAKSDLAKVGTSVWNTAKASGTSFLNSLNTAGKEDLQPTPFLTIKDSIKIFYYLIASDGVLTDEEKEHFELIGREMDPDFAQNKAEIELECCDNLQKESDPAFYLDNVIRCAGEAVQHSQSIPDGEIRPNHIIWDMLCIANSDRDYSDAEKRFIRYMAHSMNVENSVILEMQTAIHTIKTLEEEEAWIRTEDRKYSEIESHLNEINKRKQTIMQGIQALIQD